MSVPDSVRRALRATLPTGVFRRGSRLADALMAHVRLSRREARVLLEILDGRFDASRDELVELHPRGLGASMWIRNRSADARSFIGSCIRSEYEPLLPATDPEFVVDAGAYIGDFSMLALSRFPLSNVVAVEPQEDALLVARRNISQFGRRASAIHAAVWHRDDSLDVAGEGLTASVSADARGARTRALAIPSILREASFPRLDLLKCDIEGAEAEVFGRSSEEWLEGTHRVLIELHGPEAEATVRRACDRAGLSYRGRFRTTHCFVRR